MAVRPERKLKYDDYVHFPPDKRWELIDGEALVVPAPNARHQRMLMRLSGWLFRHVEEHGGGEVFAAPFDVVLSDFDVFQPDVVFIASEDMDVLTAANVRGSPTWAIEVLSESQPWRDRKLKLQRYETFRVKEYWIVDPIEDSLAIYRLSGDKYGEPVVLSPGDLAAPLKPVGFTVDLTRLFEE